MEGPLTRRVRDYWQHPTRGNRPTDYLNAPPERSAFLVQLLSAHIPPPASVLEVGCNAGRNLEALRLRGFGPLAGLEINRRALRTLRRELPRLAAEARVVIGPAEDSIRRFPAGGFDLVVAFAVLEHLPPTSDGIFGEMVRVARRAVVTVEDEVSQTEKSGRHFPRDYGAVFTGLGLRQAEAVPFSEAEGLDRNFVARVFLKPG